MIEKLNIRCFGSFKQFDWDQSVRDDKGDVAKFKKLNVLFGRNYSGKTTFSRAIRSLETGILPPKYSSPDFSVITDSSTVNHDQVPSADLNVRVYNRDFVDENLRFLLDDTGDITPFAIVGSENNEIEKRISEKEAELGSIESKSGSRFELSVSESKFEAAENRLSAAEQALEKKLREKATRSGSGMKHSSQIFGDANYTLPKIKKDIIGVTGDPNLLLDETEKSVREKFVTEAALADAGFLAFEPKIAELRAGAHELIHKEVKPSVAIPELLSDHRLQDWVETGLPLHRELRQTCGFCSSPLPKDFWDRIDNHFSEASRQLVQSLEQHAAAIQSEIRTADGVATASRPDLYAEFRDRFDSAKGELDVELKLYRSSLDGLRESLLTKSKDIFGHQSSLAPNYDHQTILGQIRIINEIIQENNEKTKTLTQDQIQARKELRLNEVANFIADIGYAGELEEIVNLEKEKTEASGEYERLKIRVQNAEGEIEAFRVQLHDEKKGADKVNELLAKYFGHGSLRLVAEEVDSSSVFRFKVMRGDTPAFNLSEGECSLVAFCYFIAKLDLESAPSDLIILIDDPISSLDSNHVFFIYSLIESLIACPKVDADGEKSLVDNKPVYRYEQLFISTHNLEFLKYLKRLSRPQKKPRAVSRSWRSRRQSNQVDAKLFEALYY